jgi:hypothetical protein
VKETTDRRGRVRQHGGGGTRPRCVVEVEAALGGASCAGVGATPGEVEEAESGVA